MPQAAFHLSEPDRRLSCVVFASPHSSSDYPRSFLRDVLLDEHAIRSSEDAFVDLLFDAAPDFGAPFLKAGAPRAFVTTPGQGINLYRGTWHGVLTPLHAPGMFAVVDRIGGTPNLEEHWLDTPVTITAPRAPA